MTQGNERRIRSTRISGAWPLTILSTRNQAQSLVKQEIVSNLSTTGFYFQSPIKYWLEHPHLVRVEIGAQGHVIAKVEIVRQEELPDEEFGYGARFVAMGEEDLRKLGEHLTERRQQEIQGDPAMRREQPTYRRGRRAS